MRDSFSYFLAMEKEMATRSSVLAWRIPGTLEPDGLLSMVSHRVGHDWSDLAAAAAATGNRRVSLLSWMFLQIPFSQSNLYITEAHLGVAYSGPQQQSFYLMIPLWNKQGLCDGHGRVWGLWQWAYRWNVRQYIWAITWLLVKHRLEVSSLYFSF